VLALAFGLPTAYFIATQPERTRAIWLFLVTIPFWTNLLIRTFAIQEVIRNEGLVNTLLMGAGLIHSPIQLLVHRLRHNGRHALCFSPPHGAADLRQHGEARLPPGGSRI
jgi:ABC-type spermidine/putrescine transport system permease subunit I